MSTLLRWLAGDKVQEVTFDAVLSLTPAQTAQVTTHPVEEGGDVADHVQIEPLRLSLEAVVTNTPIAEPANFKSGARGAVDGGVLTFDRDMQRPRDVYAALSAAMLGKSLFTVYHAHSSHENLVIVGLSTPREPGSAHQVDGDLVVDRLTFTIEFQQIRVVGSKTGEVRKAKAGTPAKKKDKGQKDKKEASQNESVLHGFLYSQ